VDELYNEDELLAHLKEKSKHRMRRVIEKMTDYERGYKQALDDISSPQAVVAERWSLSECPRCAENFRDYEPCDDGYYKRAMSMLRCPYCGQKLDWSKVN